MHHKQLLNMFNSNASQTITQYVQLKRIYKQLLNMFISYHKHTISANKTVHV